jgi:hypothetical protein
MALFVKANVLSKAMADTGSAKGKAVKIGQFLTPNVNRTVPIQVKGRSGRATLRAQAGTRGKEKLYYFEVSWDVADPNPTDEPIEFGNKTAAGVVKALAPKMNVPTETAMHATSTDKTATPGGLSAGSGNGEEWA